MASVGNPYHNIVLLSAKPDLLHEGNRIVGGCSRIRCSEEEEEECENSEYGTMNTLMRCSTHENTFRALKSRKRRGPGHVACMGQKSIK